MQVLADSMIRELMSGGSIAIDPKPEDVQIQSASVDLRLDKIYRLVAKNGVIDIARPDDVAYEEVRQNDGEWVMRPRELYFFKTIERIKFGRSVTRMHISPRSSLARAMVETTPFVGGSSHWVEYPEVRHEIFGTIKSHVFNVALRRGDRIAQAVFLSDGGEENTINLTAEEFQVPRSLSEKFYISDVSKMDLFEKERMKEFLIFPGRTAKVLAKEDFDYSNGNKAAIVMFRGGGIATGYANMANYAMGFSDSPCGVTPLSTGWAPFVDPGYVGKLYGFIADNGMPKTVKAGDKVITMVEYGVKGKVRRLYGSKELGSHYAKKN